MSGLWSFRDEVPSTLSVCEGTRSVLPAAADDFVVQDVPVEDESPLVGCTAQIFETAADVGLVVEEVQTEWVKKTLGVLKNRPYHLDVQRQEDFEPLLGLVGKGSPSGGTSSKLFDFENMEVVRSLLKPREGLGNKAGTTFCKSSWEPTVPSLATLRTAEVARRRHGKLAKERSCCAVSAGTATFQASDVHGVRTLSSVQSLDHVTKREWSRCKPSTKRSEASSLNAARVHQTVVQCTRRTSPGAKRSLLPTPNPLVKNMGAAPSICCAEGEGCCHMMRSL